MSRDLFYHRLNVEIERYRRIQLAVWCYAYEVLANPIVSDGHFDKAARAIRPYVLTGNEEMDKFFQTEFQPNTGSWIHKHPNLDGIEQLYLKGYRYAPNAN